MIPAPPSDAPTLRDVLTALERVAPTELAASWDNVGLQIGDPSAPIARGVVALDRSFDALDFAQAETADLLVTHHPLFFAAPKRLDLSRGEGRFAAEAIRRGVAVVAAHTNWDNAQDGLNDALAAALGLVEVEPFGSGGEIALASIIVYTPAGTEEPIIEAMSEAGAGAIGPYRRCAFVSPGVGTFEALPGARPAVGSIGRREQVSEVRIKMVLPLSRRDAVVRAMKAAHPYELVAHSVLPLEDGVRHASGRIGALPAPLAPEAFLEHLRSSLGSRPTLWGPKREIRRVAVVGGAADGEWGAALAAGADAFVTGEVKQHHALAAAEAGLVIVAAGHHATEDPGCAHLAARLAEEVSGVGWIHYAPQPGAAGRPW